MRQIKFRVFNKKTKELLNVDRIFFNENIVQVGYGWNVKVWDFNDIELMQSTGLLDKKGKEIYVGDILKTPIDEAYIVGDLRSFYYYLDCEQLMGCYQEREKILHLEIIGNIHKNPELLETKQ